MESSLKRSSRRGVCVNVCQPRDLIACQSILVIRDRDEESRRGHLEIPGKPRNNFGGEGEDVGSKDQVKRQRNVI